MNIGNITSNNMNLTENGRFMQIEIYEKEIERLNNIINELEEWCLSWKENDKYCYLASNDKDKCRYDIWEEVLDKLQELKGSEQVMSEEVNELLDKLGKLEDAPLIWINKKVYDTPKEIERLNNIINELEEYIKPFLYMLNGITDRDIYEECQLEDFTMIMEKLQELKGDGK